MHKVNNLEGTVFTGLKPGDLFCFVRPFFSYLRVLFLVDDQYKQFELHLEKFGVDGEASLTYQNLDRKIFLVTELAKLYRSGSIEWIKILTPDGKLGRVYFEGFANKLLLIRLNNHVNKFKSG